MRSLPSADTGSDTEKRERGIGSALEGLEGEGFCLDPPSEILVTTATWRLPEEGSEGQSSGRSVSGLPRIPDPMDPSFS